jgi:hypothetical protein
MQFDTTKPPNFIYIKGTDTRVDIGMMSEDEFEIFKYEMTVRLTTHYLERRARMIVEAKPERHTTAPLHFVDGIGLVEG